MAEKIKLLPDAIANQIAAGEVIQRPASVVKELMENAIDAGAKNIKLIIKDAGRTLIQIIDDGSGMSEIDARMCFERHATSKISNINDLFNLYTMGFRGEAMASIAAVAHVELKTKMPEKNIGTCVIIEGSKIVLQEPCATTDGTSIAVKNLFYNVPARRNFLKSNQIETKHILDEFIHVALAYPEVFFSLHHNGSEIYHLKQGNLRQRIVSVFGKNHNDKLVPIEEKTEYVSVQGFIGKPELSKKTRGEQFFFVNNRFIKSNLFNHAIASAYENLIQEKSFPFYCLFIDILPSAIDINVHPSKQEIKFEDEKSVYALLKASAKHALSQYSVMPTIDFEHHSNFNFITRQDDEFKTTYKTAGSKVNHTEMKQQLNKEYIEARHVDNFNNWEKLYLLDDETEQKIVTMQSKMQLDEESEIALKHIFKPIQIHQKYILTQVKSGYILIDQNRAHQRILFEQYLQQLEQKNVGSQQTLFPKTIHIQANDYLYIEEILSDLRNIGFDIEPFGNNTIIIHGTPTELANEDEQSLIESVLQHYKESRHMDSLDKHQKIAQSLAQHAAVKSNTYLDEKSMQNIIDSLFACSQPNVNPSGLKTFVSYTFDDINLKFEK
jgi:DNA mismatch repair protein MutL